MASLKKFATLLLCLGVLAWGGPVAAMSLFPPAPMKSMVSANADSQSCCATQGKAVAHNHGSYSDNHACVSGACGSGMHACSAVVLTPHGPSFVFTTDTAPANAASLAPIGAFPPLLPPPCA